jgi:hypothetical protein
MAARRRTPNPTPPPPRRRATLIPAHPYQAPAAGSCACDDGDHLPCAVDGCGASQHAYVHTDAAAGEDYHLLRVDGVDQLGVADTTG